MNWFFVHVFLYIHCVWFLFGISYKDSIYDILMQEEHRCKKFAIKTLNKKKCYSFLNGLKWAIFS
jgi:hypothetical protein